MDVLPPLPLPMTLVVFVALATAIWLAGTRLSYLADAIGDRARIGQALMGLIFLASITELPELVTTAAAALKGNAALALNNMFGGIAMQTAILAVADAAVIGATLTSYPRKSTPVLEGTLLVLMLAVILAVISLGDVVLPGGVGLGTVVLAGIYVLTIVTLDHYDRRHVWRPVDLPETDQDEPLTHPNAFRTLPPRNLALQSVATAAVILVCGVLLVDACEAIAVQTGLGNSFVGATLLATTTSLPELSTTVAAARMGAYTMAISNIFGSNLIMVLVLFPADIFYRAGAILNRADDTARLALIAGVAVTTIYIIGLLFRHKPRVLGMGLDSLLVLLIYGATVWAFYLVR